MLVYAVLKNIGYKSGQCRCRKHALTEQSAAASNFWLCWYPCASVKTWTCPAIPVHLPTLKAWIVPINTLWIHGRDQNSRPALACASRSVDDRGWLGSVLR